MSIGLFLGLLILIFWYHLSRWLIRFLLVSLVGSQVSKKFKEVMDHGSKGV